jgi:hypothetical protein
MRDRDQELRTNSESVGISGWGFDVSQQQNNFDSTDGSQNRYEPPTLLLGELAQKPPAQQLAQDTLSEVCLRYRHCKFSLSIQRLVVSKR